MLNGESRKILLDCGPRGMTQAISACNLYSFRLKMKSASLKVLMSSILFSLHSRCTEFLVCCACVAYKEARGKSHSTSYIFTLKRCSGRAFPHKGTHLLQTFTHCIVTQVLGSTTPVVAQKETPLYFILLRSSQPSAIHLSLPYI